MKSLSIIAGAMLLSNGLYAQNEMLCNFVNLSGDITSNRLLSKDTFYRLDGCVTIKNGVTLDIEEGTTIFGRKATSGRLLIEKGAILNANGTASEPIIFTSDQTATNREAGNWGGIAMAGNAPNNVIGGNLEVEDFGCPFEAGGILNSDNSGVVKNVQIHYADIGLLLASVGNQTEIENVMVTNVARHAFDFRGGTVNAKRLIAMDSEETDFRFDWGNNSMIQHALSLRLSPTAIKPQANAIYIQNDPLGSSNAPVTRPVVSNFTALSQKYCGATPDADYEAAVKITNNGAAGIYNSLFSGWNEGLILSGTASQDRAGTDLLFEYNTFYENVNTESDGGSWSVGACSPSLSDWLFGAFGCFQNGNELLLSLPGYSASICTNYDYSLTNPDFSLTTSSMAAPDYLVADISNNSTFFETPDKRGAFDATDWTEVWAEWYPQGVNYCPAELVNTSMAKIKSNTDHLSIAPNPAQNSALINFMADKEGKAQIKIFDVAGRVMISEEFETQTGSNANLINTTALPSGVYFLHLNIDEQRPSIKKLVIE